MDFSLCHSLEELILVDCTSLKSVHESIGNLERLVYLNMKDCKNLRMLPKNMCMLKSLEILILSGCSSLDEFPVEMMKQIESLKVLKTDGIPLSELWPERSSSILSSFPCSLVELNLSRCNLSDDAFPWDLSNLSSIRRLDLDENPICSLPVFIKGLRRLDHLSFYECKRLESLLGLPKGYQYLTVSQCSSLQKVSYLQDHSVNWSPEGHTIGGCTDNLVEWQYLYKLEPIGRVDVEMIKLLGLCNLESLPNIRMHKIGRIVWCDSDWTPVQGLYQYGIFSTFLPGNEFFPRNEVPGRLIHKSGGSSSISFTVPLLPDHRVRGLNVLAVYENCIDCSDTEVDYDCIDVKMAIKVSNKSKGLNWIYAPIIYGIPGEGEDMTWLSHWKMENEKIALECGDEVFVSVLIRRRWFQLKDFGVELVQEHQNNTMISTQHNTKSDPNYPFVISGDLSMYEHIPGIYFLGSFSKEYIESMPRSNWINHFIMDSNEEDTDKEEGQEDEHDYTIAKKRAASNNCSLGGWKVLLITVGFFFTLALVLWSSISQKKK